MFKKDEEFDDVAQYKKSRNNTNQLGEEYNRASRFEKRDDYIYDDVHEDHMDEYKEPQRETRESQKDFQREVFSQQNKKPKKKSNVTAIVIIGVIAFIFFQFLSAFMSEDEYIDYDDGDADVSEKVETEFDEYVMNGEKINAKEFVKQYKIARKNRIKYNRIQRTYVSGDYSKSYVVNKRYVSFEYPDDSDVTYYCLRKDNEDEDEGNEELKSCGINDLDNSPSPDDFMRVIEEKGIALYNYDLDNSESSDYYNINGYIYSKEFCDLVVEYTKGKTI